MNKYRIFNNSILLVCCLLFSFSFLKSQSTELRLILSDKPQFDKSSLNSSILKTPLSDTIFINNAGLVLLHPYLITLFERAGYTTENKFLNPTSQTSGIYLLQYAATGEDSSPEDFLTLNKLLCGTAIDKLTTDNIQLSEQNKKLVESMLQGLLNNWSVLGQSTIESLRESFILREGLLVEQEDKWMLTVESRGFDILLDRLPYNYSPIKLPWMKKPLHVKWRQ